MASIRKRGKKFQVVKPFNFKLAGKLRSEKQFYAVATFYAIELALHYYIHNDITSLSNLQSAMYQYTSGPSYQIVHGSNGGHKKSQKSKTYKKQALEIYKARKL